MDLSWFVTSLLAFARRYPDIALSIPCFLFIFSLYRSHRLPRNWPIVGHLPSIIADLHHLHDFITFRFKEVGCTFKFKGPWYLGMDFLMTCDPANVNHIFNVNYSNYPKGDDFLEIFDILGDGIFNSDSESWRSQRKKAHALMSNQRFQSFLARCSREKVERGLIPLLNQIAQLERVVDLQDVFLRFTFDSTCILVLGVDPGCLEISLPTVPFAKAIDEAEQALLFRHIVPRSWWKLLRWLRIGEEKKMAMAWEVIDHFIAQYVSKRREDLSRLRTHDNDMKAEEAPADLLTSYIDEQKDSLESDKFLRDTMLNFMLAGRDTTGSALTWFFWLVSKNPHVETKILEELKANSSKNKEPILDDLTMFDVEETEKLVYLHAALCESLRLFPPVPFEHKGVLQPDVLPSGHKVNPGAKIMFSLYSMARMEGIWGKDCLEFKPERWISERGKLRHEPSYKFLSFNSGPRTCLGKHMAFTQMKAVVAAMIYNFHVHVLEGHIIEPKLSIILHMKNGFKVRIRKRSK